MKVRRVLVGLEPASRQRGVIEAAARLAARMEAELVGLYVENMDLLRLAGLPFAREVCAASARRRQLDVAAVERALRASAREAQQVLAEVAGQVPVRWSFQVTRGSRVAPLLAAAVDADFVIAAIEEAIVPAHPARLRIVRAGDAGALRRALAQGDGILLLAGADSAAIRNTLRELLEEAE